MKRIFLIFPLFLALNCFGQSETKEDFVNEVYKSLVGKKHNYYLNETANEITQEQDHLKYYKADLQQLIPIQVINELLDNTFHSTSDTLWDFTKLVNVIGYNNDSSKLFSLLNGLIFLQTGPDSEQTKAKQIELDQRGNQIEGLYTFSQPVFDHTHQYALMSLGLNCEMLCGNGYV